MEAMGLAYVALGMLAGASLGWALARSRAMSETNSVEEELIRAKALLEVGSKSEEKTQQQMLDGLASWLRSDNVRMDIRGRSFD